MSRRRADPPAPLPGAAGAHPTLTQRNAFTTSLRMRLIAFGDVHMAVSTVDRLGPELRRTDAVLLSGDLTVLGGPADAERVVAAVEHYAPRVWALAGNVDRRAVLDYLCERGVSLHGTSQRIGDIGIFGCGGSNRTPMNTPIEFSEDELAGLLTAAHAAAADAPIRVMICHAPPADTQTDRLWNGTHVGSPAVRAFIERHQPDVCVTGHVHESAGVDRIGRTTIVNTGAFCNGGYAVLTAAGGAIRAELEFLA